MIDYRIFVTGAELFAKRRKRSEKWVVGETNGTRQTPLLPEIPATPVPLVSPVVPPPINNLPPPSYLPETVERLQHKQKLDGIQVSSLSPNKVLDLCYLKKFKKNLLL